MSAIFYVASVYPENGRWLGRLVGDWRVLPGVAFICEAQVLYRDIALSECGYYLFRFANGDTRVVGSMYDEERGGDALY